jgi:hypothetical protein
VASDRTVLTTEAYADPSRLVTRYSLYRFREPQLDLPAVITDPEPVVAFVGSLGAWRPQTIHDAVLDRIRHRVADAIARDGEFRFRTRIGILVCR